MKHKILAEIKRMLSIYDDDNIHDVAKYNVLIDIRDFIKSLPEESVSEDLEDAALLYCNSEWRVKEPLEAFKAGVKWKEQELINKAVEWLKSNVTYTHPTRGEKCIVNINAFKKAMKGE